MSTSGATTRHMTLAGVRSRPAWYCRPGRGALCRSAWARSKEGSLRPRSLLPLTLTPTLQLAQEALPANASQQIHAFSSTTLDDILQAFSEVSTTRVVGGYLLMVGLRPATLPPLQQVSPPEIPV